VLLKEAALSGDLRQALLDADGRVEGWRHVCSIVAVPEDAAMHFLRTS
jgi:hypothetical protein